MGQKKKRNRTHQNPKNHLNRQESERHAGCENGCSPHSEGQVNQWPDKWQIK